jgi:photosystem II stability/assembly factor-like uncharacterized protein
MKTKLIILLVFTYNQLVAQVSKPSLGNNYNTYKREMDAFFSTNDRGKGSGYKQYMRSQWVLDGRVNANGKIQNFEALNYNAWQLVQQKSQNKAKTQATHGLWEDLGPHDSYGSDSYSSSALCRVNIIAFHPTDPNTLWVGTPVGGLWKTTDHGGSWACITNNFASAGITDIAVNPTNPNEIYILTGDGDTAARSADCNSIGVMKTTDGGATWKFTGLKFGPNQYVNGHRLVMHPTNPLILLAAMRDGIYKTSNGGDTWAKTADILTWDIEFNKTDPTIIYAVNSFNGVLKSINTGTSFIPINSGFPTDPMHPTNPKNWVRLSLSVSTSNPNHIYVLCGGIPASGAFSGLFKSVDAGANWVRMSNTPNIFSSSADGGGMSNQADYDICLDVNPTNSAQIFMGGINGWKSDNNGVSWSRETNWQRAFGSVDPFVHADWHDVKYRGSRIYSCNDGGVYYSDDFGHSWADISSGLGATMFYNIDILGTNYIGGTQDNGTGEGTVGNLQSHNILGGDGFGAIWHKTNSNIKFLTTQNSIQRRQDGIVNHPIKSGDGRYWFCTLKHATNIPSNGLQIFFAIEDKIRLIRGNPMNDITITDYSWYNCNNDIKARGKLNGYSQGTNNFNVMYLAHTDTLLKTTDIYNAVNASWVGMTEPVNGLTYMDVQCDPANSNRLWVVCGGYSAGNKVFFSSNGGTSWTNISGTLPNVPIRTIELQDGGGDRVYIGTEIGVFYKQAGMTDWAYYSNNLPNTIVADLRISGSYIYAGTYGRGLWRSELYTVCPLNLTLTPANETNPNPFAPGTQVHSASVSTTSTRVYPGSVGTNIYYNGGQFVDLKPGFEIKTDAFMEVKNKGCPN